MRESLTCSDHVVKVTEPQNHKVDLDVSIEKSWAPACLKPCGLARSIKRSGLKSSQELRRFGFSVRATLFASRNVSIADNPLQEWVHIPPKMTGAISLAFKARNNPPPGRDHFTELWLCNPALGLAGPERVLSSLSPHVRAYNGPPFTVIVRRGVPGFGGLEGPVPRSLLSVIVARSRGSIPQLNFG